MLSTYRDPFEGGMLRSQLERVNPQRMFLTIRNGEIVSFLERRALK